jgi:hypothetical protein
MALSAEKIAQAKSKAKDYVEYSLYVLALLLNVDLEEIDENSTNPIDPANVETYNAYECLLMQAKVYISLVS